MGLLGHDEVSEWSKPSETIIVFDWDDTLCPSSWIRDNRPSLSYFSPPPPEDRFLLPLRDLQQAVSELLECAMKLGKVVIITNSKQNWVDTSCKNFLPQVEHQLPDIPIIYAAEKWNALSYRDQLNWRDKLAQQNYGDRNNCKDDTEEIHLDSFVEADGPNPSTIWKTRAFGDELSDFYASKNWSNVISIGDAVYERIATKVSMDVCSPKGKKKQQRAKTIKLFDDPSIEDLTKQVKKMLSILPVLVTHDANIDIEFGSEDIE